MSQALRQSTASVRPARQDMQSKMFTDIARMMEEATGIVFPDSKSSLVQARVSKRMVALRMNRFEDYTAFLASPDGKAEHEQLVFSLTTNVTRFFREPHHFTDLSANVLPDLVQRARAGERVRIWSAGCSSGEEPYSIALLTLAIDPSIGRKDFKILATDLDRNMIINGKRGHYPATATQSAPDEFSGLLSTRSGAVSIPEAAKNLVSFRELNLLHDWPFTRSFDVIFCRNVVIYFKGDVAEGLWQRFAERLPRGGRLYAGHSERVRSPDRYRLKPYGITSYEKL